jgi:hypothetical protein
VDNYPDQIAALLNRHRGQRFKARARERLMESNMCVHNTLSEGNTGVREIEIESGNTL